jgi:hypothetical protein
MHYILSDDNSVTPVDALEWSQWFEQADDRRIVGRDKKDDVEVSTVFLGIDHSFGLGGPPILWETMVFGGDHDHEQERYSSREDAVAGHARWCKLALGREPC